ncbi:(Na+)-NQR maturation NqrM [Parahaliea mediterranea]|uniref:(Na+)-NQR maturation NqrM n=1 Tax=Parahaliea mediterranea TaxID=651086 RepID=UPI000E2EADD4|nr:(Na+)-NQR maturation NqrM [Parahaliea mediterranea]
MAIFLISALVFAAVIAAMAVGVMAGRAPIKGSCGGIGALGIDQSCEICGGDPKRCDEETRGSEGSGGASFYDASDKR